MKTWRFGEAKKSLREVVDRALSEGPQEVFVSRNKSVVVISRKELDRVTPGGVGKFFQTAPDLEDLAEMVARLKQSRNC